MTNAAPSRPGYADSPIQPGPGVVPPFAVPPREGSRRRLWTGLGIGAAVLVLCAGGGIAGLVALVVSSENAQKSEAHAVVSRYMTAWQGRDYTGAYSLLCQDLHDTTTLGAFTVTLETDPVSSFDVGSATINTDTTIVPVRIGFADGQYEVNSFQVVVEDQESKVCGVTR